MPPTPLTTAEVDQILAAEPRLHACVSSVIDTFNDEDHPMLLRQTAYLQAQGWFDRIREAPFGFESKRALVKRLRDDAVAELRDSGQMKSGFVGWFLLNFVILPYLGALIRKWLFNGTST